jgi:hypothetical protein
MTNSTGVPGTGTRPVPRPATADDAAEITRLRSQPVLSEPLDEEWLVICRDQPLTTSPPLRPDPAHPRAAARPPTGPPKAQDRPPLDTELLTTGWFCVRTADLHVLRCYTLRP